MNIETIKRKGFAISLIAFPVMLLTGFVMHPHLLKFEALNTVEQLVGRFHHQPIYHIGHLIVMFAVPVIMISMISIMNLVRGKGKRLAFWGGVIGLFGAFILAVDKGALCLVLSAFDTLPEAEFREFEQFLGVILNKAGLLWVVWLLPLLPLGAAMQAIGLYKDRFINKWQAFSIVTGLLLLNNPDIEAISSVGALLMCSGYLPWGIKILQGRMKCNSVICPLFLTHPEIKHRCNKICA
jgi:hypothetical protein